MEVKPSTVAALDAWLGPETWDSDNPTDRRRFYRFVKQYADDHGHTLNESDTRAMIKDKVISKNRAYGDYQEELVHRYVRRAVNILEFLSAN